MTVGCGDLCNLALAARSFSACCALTCLLQPSHSQKSPRAKAQRCPAVRGSQGTVFPAALEGRFYCSMFGHRVFSQVKSNLHVAAENILIGLNLMRKGVPRTWCWVLVSSSGSDTGM